MSMQFRPRLVHLTAVAGVALLCACGSGTAAKKGPSDSSSTSPPLTKTSSLGSPAATGSPVTGGTLVANADFGEPLGLDPVKDTIDGDVGMSDYAAIFDVLVRYDPIKNVYLPQLASSLSSNSDHTEWTVKLRPGVTFSDGTPLNAAAVKYNVDRYSGPDSIQYYASVLAQIASVTTPDDLTVAFKLKSPDGQFPWILTQGLGLVGSPTAIQKEGAQAFNLHPVGAGPFMVSKFSPGRELDVVRNPRYWNGPAYLDAIHFVFPQGDRTKVQGLTNGDLGMVHVLDPVATDTALGKGQAGFNWLRFGGGSVLMNERSKHPASDVRVRQAIAYAINPSVINQRVYNNKGIASSALFPVGLFHTNTPSLEYDAAKARTLLQTVMKDNGWDGSIRILVSNDPVVQAQALTVQAMLNAVGFHSTVDTAPSVSAFVNDVYVTFNYDIAIAALNVTESDPWAQLVQEFVGPFAPDGYNNPEMTAALDQLRAAGSLDEQRAALSKIQTIWNETVPEVWFSVGQDALLWNPKLHGAVPSSQSTVLLGKAWLSR